MAKLNIDIPHNLPPEEALLRIQGLLRDTRRQYGNEISDLSESWDGNTGRFRFKARGFDIAGTMTVKPSVVELRGEVPFAVSLFKGKISRIISEQAGRLLS